MRRAQLSISYEHIISIENLLCAWREFVRGKRKRKDVEGFGRYLMANILELHEDLRLGTYHHAGYQHFRITDPKSRDIHKASVRDRLLHHALHRTLYPFFDRTFIHDSYSCRKGKGTHKALERFRTFFAGESGRGSGVWVLKCDIRKFFASVDQKILLKILSTRIHDTRLLTLLENVVLSFDSGHSGKGLPLGNLTSQLFVNIYMNELDQFVKHRLKMRRYIRYADDFAFISKDLVLLRKTLIAVHKFLTDELKLELHPDKVSVSKVSAGVDFLGWVHFTDHRVLHTSTKRRMLKRIEETEGKEETVQSYLGLLAHGNTWTLQQRVTGLSNALELEAAAP